MTLHRLTEPTEFDAPVLIAAFDGWIDTAGAATACANHVADGGSMVAAFDADALNDYRSRRPVLDVVDGTLSQVSWPEIRMHHRQVDGRDLLVLVGPEPDYRWRELAADVSELARRLGVSEWISLGAIPAAVPHTRATAVFATASQPGLLRSGEEQGPQGLLRVPSAALSVVELEVSGAGIPSVGFYAQVPHYVGGSYAAGAIALLEHVERHLGVSIPLGPLSDEALAQRTRLDAAVAGDPSSREYVERLEAAVGEERIPSGDELASEIERFLRGEAGGEDANPFDER
jgi:predicted ATP-grasp superfamily ATP-dependent carboligase